MAINHPTFIFFHLDPGFNHARTKPAYFCSLCHVTYGHSLDFSLRSWNQLGRGGLSLNERGSKLLGSSLKDKLNLVQGKNFGLLGENPGLCWTPPLPPLDI